MFDGDLSPANNRILHPGPRGASLKEAIMAVLGRPILAVQRGDQDGFNISKLMRDIEVVEVIVRNWNNWVRAWFAILIYGFIILRLL